MAKVSKKFEKMAELYKYFSKDWSNLLDYSYDAKIAMFEYESHGTPLEKAETNGYAVGKKWMDVNVAMWKEDIANGNLRKQELYADGDLPADWLDKVLK